MDGYTLMKGSIDEVMDIRRYGVTMLSDGYTMYTKGCIFEETA